MRPPHAWSADRYYCPENKMNFDEAVTFEALYDSMWKCKRGKMWKASVARYVLHGIEETLKLEEEIASGRYLPRKPHTFKLTYPKLRDCSSTHIRDRIVQRSANDNIVYPAMTNSFIWDNMACQKGKGTTKAMDRLDRNLHRYFINNGNSKDGWVLQCDIHGYYRNIRHSEADACFRRHLDDKTASMTHEWLQRQYPTDVGYAPGSQMVQIIGISLLDPFDHTIKESVGAEDYERYMDDFYVISQSRDFLEACLAVMQTELGKIGLELHPKKTHIYPIKDGIPFLGFTFRLTDTGKVVRIINPKNVKHERKKLYRMAQLVKAGKITRGKYFECYRSWRAHAELGNSWKLLKRMDGYAKSLLEEDTENVDQSHSAAGADHREAS